MKRIHIALVLLSSLWLGACASTGPALYTWGEYEDVLYKHYKTPGEVATQRAELEAHVNWLLKYNRKVPPGVYADLGSFYLQSGDAATAKQWFTKEMETWPESRTLMTALIKNIERREAARQGAPS